MRLFISVKNNQPLEHPIMVSNFKQAFPEVDLDNLPNEFAYFTRTALPDLGVYEKTYSEYQKQDDGSYKDLWHVIPMTQEEKIEKQNEIKSWWETQNKASWIFNEETCSFNPPVPYPDDGNIYVWDEDTITWVLE